jgi:hypothetical protein
LLADVPRLPFSLDRLIAEAKRRARQRRLVGTVLVLAMVVAAGVFALRVSERPAAVSGPARCLPSQIRATAAPLPGGAVYAGWAILYRNVSPSACTLSGYPTVKLSTTGLNEVATHTRSEYLGGLQSLRAPLPRVLLRDKKAVASSQVSYVSQGTAQSVCPETKKYPLRFRSISVTVPGATRSFALPVSATVFCAHLVATPIVPGGTGSLPRVP